MFMKYTILLLLLCTSVFAQNKQINVTNLNFRMQAMTEHTLSYGFAKGDKVYINYSEERDKN